MDASTLEALRGSIAKWEAIIDGTGVDRGRENCPLCQKFHPFPDTSPYTQWCRGCPVRQKTGLSGCEGTPYQEYDLLDEKIDLATDAGPLSPYYRSDDVLRQLRDSRRQAAIQELEFLRSLLPEGS